MNAFTEALSDMRAYLVSSVVPALLIFLIGLVIVRLVMEIVKKTLAKSKLEKAAHSLIKTVVKILLYGLLLLIATICALFSSPLKNLFL